MNNNKGMSLIEVLVAVGIMSIMSFFIMDMVSNQNKAIKTTQHSLDVNEVQNQVQRLMIDSETCKNTLLGYTFTTGVDVPITGIKKSPTGTPILSAGSAIGGVIIDSLIVRRVSDSDLELSINLKKSNTSTSFGGETFKPRKVNLSAKFKTSAPNEVETCFTAFDNGVATALQLACTQLCPTCTWNATTVTCVRPPTATSKPIYLNPISGQLQLTVPPSYHDVGVGCSNCGSNCTPSCPGGYSLISNNCRMTGNCGFRRWRDCNGTCRKNFGPFTPEGYLTPSP
jgi:prepilin-type N-terminal cleavage/methylation domain-containing protein